MKGDSECGGSSMPAERNRRLKMNRLFSQLQATIPRPLSKATKEVIITETIRYIKELERKKNNLEQIKELQIQSHASGTTFMLPCMANDDNCSVTVTVSANVAFFGIQTVARRGLITMILEVFSNHKAEILAANVAVNEGILTFAVTALLQIVADGEGEGEGAVEMIKREIMTL
ncbi:hypothetical protein HN51_063735 [Arachis hypogaea]|uniref:BHLH domain-containing protein n=1 Tax=Arachis hypogaea TaxID=3818 RepID=A0A445AWZ3_ARAHY|nr:transcription factor UDT1-like [Arachis ipaensis]XP_025628796.1 transcription factor UDT1-like [Arachis hypogaea]QHO21335.1 Basic helix-loop-helix protein A [Arachis hypogaea]RYR30959.1 hypothetical protein Ahy_B01g055752 [Arachis hypogaea]